MSHHTDYHGPDDITIGNGKSLDITYVGERNIHNGNLKLKNVLIVPEIKKNLLSVSQLTQYNACNIIFSTNNFVFEDLQGKLMAKGIKKDGLHALEELRKFFLSVIS